MPLTLLSTCMRHGRFRHPHSRCRIDIRDPCDQALSRHGHCVGLDVAGLRSAAGRPRAGMFRLLSSKPSPHTRTLAHSPSRHGRLTTCTGVRILHGHAVYHFLQTRTTCRICIVSAMGNDSELCPVLQKLCTYHTRTTNGIRPVRSLGTFATGPAPFWPSQHPTCF